MAIAVGHYPLGNTYLDIPEFANLSISRNNYNACPKPAKRRAYFNSFVAFLNYVIDYANQNIGVINYVNAAKKLYGNTTRKTKNVCRAHLLAVRSYAEEIKNAVFDESMLPNVNDLVTNMLSEFEDVLILSEKLLYQNVVNSKAYIPNSYSFDLTDIISAADQLMFAYATRSLSSFDYRNTQPYVMVQVRQIIENAAFNCIGVENVTIRTGNVAAGIISETLSFLSESKSAVHYTISMPIDPDILELLYKWSCSFVHKGTLAPGYIIFYAYHLVKKLLEQPIAPVLIYDGSYKLRHEHGDIRIEHYNQMQQEYIRKVNPNARRIINWLPIDKVGAYVVSL